MVLFWGCFSLENRGLSTELNTCRYRQRGANDNPGRDDPEST